VAINYEWPTSDCTVLVLRLQLKNTAESTKFKIHVQSKSTLIHIKYFTRVLHTISIIPKQGSDSKEKITNTSNVLKKNTWHITERMRLILHSWLELLWSNQNDLCLLVPLKQNIIQMYIWESGPIGISVKRNFPHSWMFVEKATKLFSQDSNEGFYWFQWCVLINTVPSALTNYQR
jgi:hypothetical protein